MEEEISLEQLNPEPNVVQSPKPDHLKIGLLIFAGLVLLGSAAYAGYWYASRQQVSQLYPELIEGQAMPTLMPDRPSPTPLVKDETNDWETYINKDLGYSLSYPKEFYKNNEWNPPIEISLEDTLWPDLSISSFDWSQYGSTDLYGYPEGLNIFIQFWGKKQYAEDPSEQTITVSFGDTQAKKVSNYMSETSVNGNKMTVDKFIVSISAGTLTIEGTYLANSKYEDLLNQILSTFQFTD